MVWYATIGLCLLSAFIVRVSFLLEKQLSSERNKKNQEELNDESNSNSMLMVFGFIFQQSTFIVSYPFSSLHIPVRYQYITIAYRLFWQPMAYILSCVNYFDAPLFSHNVSILLIVYCWLFIN